MTNNRKHPRYSCEIKTKFEYYEGDTFENDFDDIKPVKGKGLILDISKSGLFFVRDISVSKKFYTEILGQKIELDAGRYVAFENGLGFWEGKYALETIYSAPKEMETYGLKNCEIYFEVVDLDGLYKHLKQKDVPFIHQVHQHPWGQRGFRVYDPDGHIIEISEPMSEVIRRHCKQGLTPKEIAAKTTLPIEMVNDIIEKLNGCK